MYKQSIIIIKEIENNFQYIKTLGLLLGDDYCRCCNNRILPTGNSELIFCHEQDLFFFEAHKFKTVSSLQVCSHVSKEKFKDTIIAKIFAFYVLN